MSNIERGTNKQIVHIFFIQLVLCVLGALYGSTWLIMNKQKTDVYLQMMIRDANPWESNFWLVWIKTTGTWILIFT